MSNRISSLPIRIIFHLPPSIIFEVACMPFLASPIFR
jgi:hypothetical protein